MTEKAKKAAKAGNYAVPPIILAAATWLAQLLGLDLPPEVLAAVASILGFLYGKHGPGH